MKWLKINKINRYKLKVGMLVSHMLKTRVLSTNISKISKS